MRKIIIVLALFAAMGCKKENSTPTTNNVNNTVYVNPKWTKVNYVVQYAADGVTETYRSENTYDSEGRITGNISYSQGVISVKNRDYTYVGNECTYYSEYYVGGVLTSTTKTKTGYNNN